MDFGWTPEQQALQKEIRQFIQEHVTPEILDEIEQAEEGRRGPLVRALRRKVAEKGWLGLGWPKEYGGSEGDRMTKFLVELEFTRFGISVGEGGSGIPAILAAGTEEQKTEFVPKLISGEYSLALGFTEPRGGADLANLQCRAVRDGDFYIINGQKTFTSSAHTATHIYLMVRTADTTPPHRGITILLVPMDAPGITVRPIWTLQNDPRPPLGTTYGMPRTNETFLEDVRVPVTCRLGEENRGWYVGAMGLNLDRIGAWRYLISVQMDEQVVNWVKENTFDGYSLKDDPALRDRLAEMWTEANVCRLFAMRSMAMVMQNKEFTYEGSAEKVWNPEHGMRSTESIAQMLGPYGQLLSGSPGAVERGVFAHDVLSAWVSGNNHGSTHIMRDQVARRGLGLPVKHN